MKKNSRFVVQYAIKMEDNHVEVFNDEYLNIEEERAIKKTKEKHKGKEIDFWTIYYIDSKALKSKDIKTGKLTFRRREE